MVIHDFYKETLDTYLRNPDDNYYSVSVNDKLEPERIGIFICALANSAISLKVPYSYLYFGINASTGNIVGTTFNPSVDMVDKIPLQSWLIQNLSANANFSFHSIQAENKSIIVLEVQRASKTTVQFKGVEYILNYKNPEKLSDFPQIEKDIWNVLYNQITFEQKSAMDNVSEEDINKYLDCDKFYEMIEKPRLMNTLDQIQTLIGYRLITKKNTGKYIITNLGALLLARNLSYFDSVASKAVRVINYSGNDSTQSAKEQRGVKGYLIGFEGLINYIVHSLPSHEIIDLAIRRNVYSIPSLAIRELVANALIHQNFNISGYPTISIFHDRVEITNPGRPLINESRFIDNPPHSRNEEIVSVMRKAGLCEERGSGYDKIIAELEKENLPAPLINVERDYIKVTLYSKKPFDEWSKEEKVRACYMHTCLNYVQNRETNNTTLRNRFRLSENESYKVSRIFSDAVNAQTIKVVRSTGTKNRKYVPVWAPD